MFIHKSVYADILSLLENCEGFGSQRQNWQKMISRSCDMPHYGGVCTLLSGWGSKVRGVVRF